MSSRQLSLFGRFSRKNLASYGRLFGLLFLTVATNAINAHPLCYRRLNTSESLIYTNMRVAQTKKVTDVLHIDSATLRSNFASAA